MDFGFSIGDFIIVLEHANRLRKVFVGAPAQFNALCDEVRNLSIVVQDVEVDLCHADLSGKQKDELENIAKSCGNVLSEIEKVIDKYSAINRSSHGVKRAWKRLRWEPDEARELRSRISSNIAVLNAFNGRATRDSVMELLKYQTDEQYQMCLGWLSPITYATQQSDYLSRRQAGTGGWFLESRKFRAWVETPQQTLFCPGIPGAGKTILASAVVDELQAQFGENRDVGIAYVYCSFQRCDEQSQKPDNLLASILRQLAQNVEPRPGCVQELYEKHKVHEKRPSLEELSKALRSVVDCHYSRVFLVIDALDECHRPAMSRLLDETDDLKTATNLNFLATSRPIPEIVARFQSQPTQEIRAASPDVATYLSANLGLLPSFVSRNPQLQDEITAGITDAVDGMFLLAQLYLDSLVGKRSPKAIRAELQKLRNGSKTYDSAYDDAMQRIKGQVADQKKVAWEVLSWITCAKRPLSAAELLHALAVEVGESEFDSDNLPDLDDVVSACAGLVTVTVDASSNLIRFIHYTVQEYFARTWTHWFPDAHSNIATTCVTYLSFNVFEAGVSLGCEDFESRLEEYPLYSYAAKNWGHHVRAQSISEDLPMAFLEDIPKVEACVQAIFAQKPFSRGANYISEFPVGFSGLHLAAYFGLTGVVRSMVRRCDQSNLADSTGRTPLVWAAYSGHDDVVEFFLERGVDARERDWYGRTPISIAASMGWVRTVELLLELRIDPDSVDVDGQTALSWAAYRGHEDVVQLLLEKGANPDVKDQDGATPLSWASANGWLGIVRLLLERGVDIDCKDKDDRTPLSWAAENGHAAVVEFLFETGAQPDTKDAQGRRPLYYANLHRHGAVAKLIRGRYSGGCPSAQIVGGADCVVQNASDENVSRKDPSNASSRLQSKHKAYTSHEATRQPPWTCPLCPSEQSWNSHSRATFKRHIQHGHYPRTFYWCTESSCFDGVQGKRFQRRDNFAQHLRRQHNLSLGRGDADLNHMQKDEPHPGCCPVCQTVVSSWEEFDDCVFRHAGAM